MKKDSNKVVFYDNSSLYELKDEARRVLIEEGDSDPSDEDIWTLVSDWDDCAWIEFSDFMRSQFVSKVFIAHGIVQFWNGRRKASKLLYTYEDFIDFISGYDSIAIYAIGDKLFAELHHHDGTHRFELREVTDFGCRRLAIGCRDDFHFARWFDCNLYCKLPRATESWRG